MTSIVVLSGGMDSATALWLAHREGLDIQALTFDYGSKHNDREFAHAKLLCDRLEIPLTRVALPFIGEHFKSDLLKSGGEIPEGHYADPSMKRTVVPFRNGIMLSIAVGYAESVGATEVIIANHFGDHAIYPDCRLAFIKHFGAAAQAGTYAPVSVRSPFCVMDKATIARIGSLLGVPYEMTYSCYKGGEKHCGKCGTCFERKEAFQKAGLDDPTEYEA